MADSTPEEGQLSRAVAGDRAALTCLLAAHRRALIGAVARDLPSDLQGAVSAEDIVQEVFVEAFRRIDTFESRGIEAFRGWLHTIARHRLLNAIKARRAAKRGGGRAQVRRDAVRDRSVELLLEEMAVNTHTPSRSVAGHEASALLQAALASVREEYRRVIEWRYFHGLSVAETAQRLGRSEGATRMLCHRALAELKAAMGSSTAFFSRGS